MPFTAEVKDHVRNFNPSHGFPQYLGAIDETRIEIKQPRLNSADFLNRKGRYTMFRPLVIINIVLWIWLLSGQEVCTMPEYFETQS